MKDFLRDIWHGLNTSPKYLQSKYFYDEAGDEIFCEIMACPEYYLTNCEMELFAKHSKELAKTIIAKVHDFDVVELGPGDATKSVHLLKALSEQNAGYIYYPIDISENVITLLNENLPAILPGIKIHGLNGDYFDRLAVLKETSHRHKVVLFLGSNIGNITLEDTVDFFAALRSHLLPGDMLLTGFDLKKDPAVILAAYNDKQGVTKSFNLNLLARINKTLGASFDLSQFEHRPEYNAKTGECKSYLESRKDQTVRIGEMGVINFKQGERIFMEISQKYTARQTDGFAIDAGFMPLRHYYDSRHWFLDALWQATDPDETIIEVKAEVNVLLVEEVQAVG